MVILIIWAVIAMAAAFSVYEIESHSGATASEKTELMKQTAQTLKDLGITGPQAAAIIQSTQAQATEGGSGGGLFSGGSSLIKWGLYGVAAYFIYEEFFNKPKGSKQ